MIKNIAIFGAGKLGITLAQLALKAGYKVFISSSDTPEKIKLTVDVLAPGAIATTNENAAHEADVVILALPLSNFRNLPKKSLSGKLVIDAMNYWWEVDGDRDDFIDPSQSSSEAVQEFLSDSRVVKALNHMGYHHLFDEAKPPKTPGRKAIALAGNSADDVRKISKLIDDLGFDPLHIGDLSKGKILEAGGPLFGANIEIDEMKKVINQQLNTTL